MMKNRGPYSQNTFRVNGKVVSVAKDTSYLVLNSSRRRIGVDKEAGNIRIDVPVRLRGFVGGCLQQGVQCRVSGNIVCEEVTSGKRTVQRNSVQAEKFELD
jgi:hypothetical protein